MGRDFTIYAIIEGNVKFERFDRKRLKVSVYAPQDSTAKQSA
jgi:ribosomal protein L27